MDKALETELRTYEQHREHLLGTAEGKFVLIRNKEIVGVYDSKMDAIAQGYQKFGNVPFLVKQIVRIETPQNFISTEIIELGLVTGPFIAFGRLLAALDLENASQPAD